VESEVQLPHSGCIMGIMGEASRRVLPKPKLCHAVTRSLASDAWRWWSWIPHNELNSEGKTKLSTIRSTEVELD